MPRLDRIKEPGEHQQTRAVPTNSFQSDDRHTRDLAAERQQFPKMESRSMPGLDPVNTNATTNQKDIACPSSNSSAEGVVVPQSEIVLFSQDLSDDLLASHAEENW
eukprot:CAMPEP_0185270194 /NCGR_PEP_ID=MMETSP1359-20130426/41718_1 /TAXON_ID=552665 /ORGANISM="Bigelowiella longifila, Strain CCMP242" /LENGTH=105 /DNA_ID=CAMNT_0027861665 /DNA_START=220 /DNA_END=534 /DNA_ORIENTATION=-